VAIPACTAGQIVQIYMPKAKNGAYSVQQAIQMKVSTNHDLMKTLKDKPRKA
jgi:hypothetical protein